MAVRILQGDCREVLASLPDASVHCCVTSPPYWGLRDYGTATWEGGDPECDHRKVIDPDAGSKLSGLEGGKKTNGHQQEGFKLICGRCGATRVDRQLGMELDYRDHIAVMVKVFREVRRVLRDDGTLWLNYGDCYASSVNGRSASDTKAVGNDDRTFRDKPFSTVQGVLKPKDLVMMPARVAIALQEDGWWLRSEIVWAKPNPMPESITDRPSSAHEKVYLLAKSPRYFYDAEAIRESMTAASISRLAQDVESQEGSWRANGGTKTNGAMKAVAKGNARTFRGGGAYTGSQSFENDRQVERNSHGNEPNESGTRNARNVWNIPTAQFTDWQQTVRQVRVAWDAPDDGKKRITSPDCPLHGDRPGPVPNVVYDERATDLSDDSARIATRPAPIQQGDCASIEMRPALATALSMLDLPDRSDAEPATFRNTQNHRMALSPATNLSCMPCEETQPHIADRSGELGYSGSADRTLVNSIAPVDPDDHLSVQTQCHNADTFSSDLSQCTCEYYIEITEKTSHFATFPPELAERCIKAGTSEKGCCPGCYAGYSREVSVKYENPGNRTTNGPRSVERRHDTAGYEVRLEKRVITEGWHPACDCDVGPPVPCTVLDPFAGVFTTAMVADRLQRDAIGIELNPEYCAIAERRLHKDAGLFAEISR